MKFSSYKAHGLALATLTVAVLCGAQTTLFHALLDAHFSWFQRKATGEILLVAIDPPSLERVGVWPWPRTLHAQVLNKLRQAGAADIVFDVDFSSRQDAQNDREFARSLEAAQGSVVLPTFAQPVRAGDGPTSFHVAKPLSEFRKSSWSATANVALESDGLVRRYAYGADIEGQFTPSIGAILAGEYNARGSNFYIDFGIRADTVPTVSFVDVLDGAVPKEVIADKKIIIGATAVELGDRFNVPDGQILAGPLLQTLAAESLLQGRALSSTSTVVTAVGLLGLVILLIFVFEKSHGTLRLVLLAGTSVAIALIGAFLHVRWAIILDTSLWQIAIASYLAAVALDEIDFRGLLAKIAESRFRNVAMSIGDGLVCTDEKGAITFWNPGAANIFGYSQESILGRPITDLFVGDTPASLESGIGKILLDRDAPKNRVIEWIGRRRSGETFALEASVSRWKTDNTRHFGFVLRDISQRKKEEERIRYLAEHDALTGLFSRSKLKEELAELLASTSGTGGDVALVLLGLDGLKDINDTLGQDRGDTVICAIAKTLQRRFSGQGFVGRVSGDEFAVVLPITGETYQSTEYIRTVASEFAAVDVDLGDRTKSVSLSAGSAVYPGDGQTAEELMANATLALHGAKQKGRGCHVVFCAEIRSKVQAGRQLEHELRRAYEHDEFELFYQPQLDLTTLKVVGAEALIRWRHPIKGHVAPSAFLSVLDTMPLSDDVGRWVIYTACQQAAEWSKTCPDFRMGINLCPSLLEADALPEVVFNAVADSGVSTRSIELEVTENILFNDPDNAIRILNRIRDSGVAIAFDDFGTGYASLTHLKRFPIDRLKVDQTFVRDMLGNEDDRSIVSMIVGLGKLLGMHVIAEGIEDLATAQALKEMGCDEGQGYFFGHPVPAAEFSKLHLNDAAREKPGALTELLEEYT